jgi:hypothetical protein
MSVCAGCGFADEAILEHVENLAICPNCLILVMVKGVDTLGVGYLRNVMERANERLELEAAAAHTRN